jgi:hypothetical protein
MLLLLLLSLLVFKTEESKPKNLRDFIEVSHCMFYYRQSFNAKP